MNRIEIKENAKKMIKGNLWYILKPMVFLFLCLFAVELVAMLLDNLIKVSVFSAILSIVTSIVSCIFAVGYSYYCLGFIRGNKMEMQDIIEFCKKNWMISLFVSFMVGLNIIIGSILLIIPGIIASMGLTFYTYVVADNPELDVTNALRKCWEMTLGFKMDLFVFYLSFIGWAILAPFTLGILFIWLIPYMTIAETLAYETLKK